MNKMSKFTVLATFVFCVMAIINLLGGSCVYEYRIDELKAGCSWDIELNALFGYLAAVVNVIMLGVFVYIISLKRGVMASWFGAAAALSGIVKAILYIMFVITVNDKNDITYDASRILNYISVVADVNSLFTIASLALFMAETKSCKRVTSMLFVCLIVFIGLEVLQHLPFSPHLEEVTELVDVHKIIAKYYKQKLTVFHISSTMWFVAWVIYVYGLSKFINMHPVHEDSHKVEPLEEPSFTSSANVKYN